MGGVLLQTVTVFVAIWSSQTETAQSLSVYLKLSDGTHVTNHGFLLRGQLRNNPLLCVTPDNTTCCSSVESGGAPLGSWYYPNQTEIPPDVMGWQFYITRGPGVVHLHRHTGGVSGIYHCDIPDQSGVNQTLYVGLYIAAQSSGHIELQDALQFQLLTEPTLDPPVFTLTCTTTGGPPTTVSWTRNSMTVLYNSSFIFSRTVTQFTDATYTNTLTITGRYHGQYTITALNPNTDTFLVSVPASSSFQVAAADLPTNLTAVQGSNRSSILVSWTAPVSGANVTGYQIFYHAEGDWGVVDVFDGITEYTLTGLNSELTYNISLVALSEHLPSPIAGPEVVTFGGTDATTSLPDATPSLTDATTNLPDATPSLPDATTSLPDATTSLPDAATSLPDVTPSLPDVTPSPDGTSSFSYRLVMTTIGADTPDGTPHATASATTPLHSALHSTPASIPTPDLHSTLSSTPSLGATTESNEVFPRAVVGGALGAGILFGLLICTMSTCLFYLWRGKSKLFQVTPLLPEKTAAEEQNILQLYECHLPSSN